MEFVLSEYDCTYYRSCKSQVLYEGFQSDLFLASNWSIQRMNLDLVLVLMSMPFVIAF
jgi:hypothetical protein